MNGFRRLARIFRFHRNGSAAVETALLITPFLMLIVGIMELGRYFWIQSTLERALEVGVHYVYANSTTAPEVLATEVGDQIKAALIGVDSDLVTIPTPSIEAVEAGGVTTDFMTITATYLFTFAGFLEMPQSTITAQARVPVL